MREWWSKLRALVAGRRGMDEDLREEMAAHLEFEIRDDIAKGKSPDAAREAARRRFGNRTQIQELTREAWGFREVETLVQDLRYGGRMLLRNPGFTAVAVLSLALGMGAGTAVFRIADALLLKPLPVANPQELVAFRRTYQGDGGAPRSFNYPWYERFRGLSSVFADAAAIYPVDRADGAVNPGAAFDSDPQARVRLVTGNYFSVMGVGPRAGRVFTPEDDRIPGGQPVAVISYEYWQRRFGRISDIAGRTVTLSGAKYTILGVTQKGFTGEWVGRPADVWIPISMLAQVLTELPPGTYPRGGGLSYVIFARLRPGVTMEEAQAAGQVVYQQVLLEERAGPSPSAELLQRIRNARFEVERGALGYSPQRESYRQPLGILAFMVGLVLLIACANTANLMLARSAARQKEMAVRLAIGAGRGRIVRQLLTESILLSTLGGALGLLFAHWGTGALMKLAGSGVISRAEQQLTLDLAPDLRIVAFAGGLSLLIGILFGLAPAVRGTGRGTSFTPLSERRGGRLRLGKPLVTAQVALSLVLLIGAGLFVRTLHNLRAQDLGLDREHVLLVWTALRQSGRARGAPTVQLFDMAQQRIASLPGVISASVSTNGVLQGNATFPYPVRVQGYAPRAGETPMAQTDIVMPGFFETLGMRIQLGRDFGASDTESSPRVVIVNQAMARHFFCGENPIGKRIGFGYSAAGNELEIVGMASDAIQASPHDAGQMVFYTPYRQESRRLGTMCVMARIAGSPAALAGAVREELRGIDANLPVLRVNTIEGQLNDALVQERLIATLAGFFGAMAVLLACIGLYGLMAYTTTRRTGEIGIRLALGSTRTRVLAMVLKESLLLVFAGIAIGVPAALAASRLVANRLFGLGAADPLTIAGAAGVLLAVAAIAGLVPGLRASRVDPMLALRSE